MLHKKVVIVLVAIFLTPVLFFLFMDNISRFAPNKPPQDFIIQANFVDINKIESISKYRSCQGHVHVPRNNLETKRNMKHYFSLKKEFLNSNDQVTITAPFDGRLLFMPTGEIYLFPKSSGLFIFPLTRWFLDFDHIKKLTTLKTGQSVKKGEVLGYFDPTKGNNAFDVLISVMGVPRQIDNWVSPVDKLDSVFNYMSDEVFEEYKLGGVEKREDYILTKEYRDENPCVYDQGGPYFIHAAGTDDTIYFTKERY